MPRGQLILIEGLDRTGKSTQCLNLIKKFSKSKLIKFPERSTQIGKLINEYLTNPNFKLNDQSAHLLFSANRWELNDEIEKLLNDEYFVILDRYIYSGLAYTLAKNKVDTTNDTNKDDKSKNITNSENKINLSNLEWLLTPDKGLPKPDLTLFLTLKPEEISKRKGFGQERYEQETFQENVRESFLKILNDLILKGDDSIKIIDINNMNIDTITNLLWEMIEDVGGNKLTNNPIKRI
ncbi:CDC8 [Candida pseudojiufengensis]|uniref:CDC8 n=1 Tax=Candida pseudojiufengensis TaxID=497109 RepID=UPI002223FB52|nr:CDC8 [Candida pseudojiufengensis]KAI5963669.1 CDC8 [Candida pseudojiufengensis]